MSFAAPDMARETITDDRYCRACGANLIGAPIAREPHYGLPLVTCPRCAAPTPLQRHRRLTAVAGRWTGASLGLWMLVLVVTLFGGPALFFVLSMATAGTGLFKYNTIIEAEVSQWRQDRDARFADVVGPPLTSYEGLFHEWVAQVEPVDLLAAHGGWWNVIDKAAFFIWIPLGLAALALGGLWSVLAPNLSRLGRLAWTLMVAALGLLYASPPIYFAFRAEAESSWDLAAREIFPGLLILTLCFAVCCMAIGLHFGRAVLRAALTLMLPARLRSACALLWVVDGLPPPSAARKD